MNDAERKIYMGLSNDPNERGRLWKEYKAKVYGKEISKIYEKLSPQEIYELYRDMTITVCFFAPPQKVADYFDKVFLKELTLQK